MDFTHQKTLVKFASYGALKKRYNMRFCRTCLILEVSLLVN